MKTLLAMRRKTVLIALLPQLLHVHVPIRSAIESETAKWVKGTGELGS
jgi:hypothetical protein